MECIDLLYGYSLIHVAIFEDGLYVGVASNQDDFARFVTNMFSQ